MRAPAWAMVLLLIAAAAAQAQVCRSGWSAGAVAPTTIYRGQAAYWDGMVYLTTGVRQDGSQIADLYKYDPTLDTWSGGGCSFG